MLTALLLLALFLGGAAMPHVQASAANNSAATQTDKKCYYFHDTVTTTYSDSDLNSYYATENIELIAFSDVRIFREKVNTLISEAPYNADIYFEFKDFPPVDVDMDESFAYLKDVLGARIMVISHYNEAFWNYTGFLQYVDIHVCLDYFYDFMNDTFFLEVGSDLGGTFVIDSFFLQFMTVNDIYNYFVLYSNYFVSGVWSGMAIELGNGYFWEYRPSNNLYSDPFYFLIETPSNQAMGEAVQDVILSGYSYYIFEFSTTPGNGNLLCFWNSDLRALWLSNILEAFASGEDLSCFNTESNQDVITAKPYCT